MNYGRKLIKPTTVNQSVECPLKAKLVREIMERQANEEAIDTLKRLIERQESRRKESEEAFNGA